MEKPRPPLMHRFADRLVLGLLHFAESMSTFDVEVPWKQTIRFPDRCIRCADHHPETIYTVTYTRQTPLGTAFGLILPSHRKRITAPVCTACHAVCVRKRRLQRYIPFPLMLSIFLSGLYGASLLKPFLPTLSAILAIAAILGSIAIAIAVDILIIGDPFPTTQDKDDLTFHFKNADLAREFAEANGLEVTELEPLPDLANRLDSTQPDLE